MKYSKSTSAYRNYIYGHGGCKSVAQYEPSYYLDNIGENTISVDGESIQHQNIYLTCCTTDHNVDARYSTNVDNAGDYHLHFTILRTEPKVDSSSCLQFNNSSIDQLSAKFIGRHRVEKSRSYP